MKWDKVEVKTEQIIDENPETWIRAAMEEIANGDDDSALEKLRQAKKFANNNDNILVYVYMTEIPCYFFKGDMSSVRKSATQFHEAALSVEKSSGRSIFNEAFNNDPRLFFMCMKADPSNWSKTCVDAIRYQIANRKYDNIERLFAAEEITGFTDKTLAENATNDFAFAVVRDNKLNLLAALWRGGFNLSVCKDSKGKNLTMAAVTSSNYSEEILQFLLNSRINYIDEKDKNGWTALMHCVNDVGVEQLIRAGADVNARNNENQTVLMKAVTCGYGYTGNVQSLIDSGANIFLKDNNDCDALYYAEGLYIKLLVERGADINRRYEKLNGGTLLHKAAKSHWENRDHSYWQTVLNLSADVNVKDNSNKTPLEYALDHQFVFTAELDFPRALVKRGAVIDADIRAVLRRRGIKENNLHNNSTNFFFSRWF